MTGFPYRCPNCRDRWQKHLTIIVYDYGKRKPVCDKCGTPISEFIPDNRPIAAEII